MKAREARLAAGLTALAVVAAACGGGVGDAAADEVATEATVVVTEAPAATAAPTTAAPATTAAAAPADAMELLVNSFESSAGRSVRGDVQMDMGVLPAVAMHFEGDGSQNFSMTMSFDEMMGSGGPAGFGFEIRFVEGLQYVQFVVPEELRSLVGDELPEGWFVLDAASAAEMGIVCPSALPGETPDDGACRLPNDNTNLIEFVTSAEIIGPELIDGLPTTHVRYTLDIAAMAEGVIAESEGMDDLLPFGTDFFSGEYTYDAWIDREGLTRRMSVDPGSLIEDVIAGLDEAETEGHEEEIAGLLDFSQVINYYDYDADITIEAPTADEIVGDFGDMMGTEPSVG